MSKHTPGPWHMGAGNGEGSIFADNGRMRFENGTTLYPIASVNQGWEVDEDEANACLIAAAPELFSALKEIISQIDQGGSSGKVFARDACIAAARAAIAKAVAAEIEIDGLTFEQYCNDPDRVRADAIAAGVKGEQYVHYCMTKGRYNGKTRVKYRELNNMDLYLFAKQKYGRQ